jgi:alpha-L-rhamnosidase
LRISIPPGATAVIRLPSRNPATVTESGVKLKQATGVTFLRQLGNRTIIQVTSGQFEFKSTW